MLLLSQPAPTFRDAIHRLYLLDRSVLLRMVYGAARRFRTGNLQRHELFVERSPGVIEFINDASSDGFYYGWIIIRGHPGRSVPTAKRGKMWYAWVDPGHTRPQPFDSEGWRKGLKEGWAHRSKHFGPFPKRDWRTEAIQKGVPYIREQFTNMMVRIHASG